MMALVTGGAGFIGSHLVDRLLADGWDVDCVDNFDPFYPRDRKERNIAAHRDHPRYRLHEADIRDAAALARIEATPDVIVHLAARAGVRPSIADPATYQDVNVRGTQNLLEWARERGVRQFVFASSSSVYGVNPDTPWREDDHGLRPISPYAATKVAGELLGHVYSHLHGIRFTALRFFTVYGPRQRPDLAIHAFARRMLAGEALPLFGDGTTSRDYTYIDDIVQGILAAMAHDAPFDVINLGNDAAVSLREMVDTLQDALGVAARVEHHPAQPGDVPHTRASLAHAEAALGYRPTTPFPQGVQRFAAWLREEGHAGGTA